MYKCLDCGNIFEEGEQREWQESRGEYWGHPAYETVIGCPCCGGAYEETMPCAICSSEHLEDELHGGICDECLKEHTYDVDTCLKIGAIDKEEIEINSLLVTLFTQEEIEEILIRELKESGKIKPVDCSDFVYDDPDWFGEALRKEVLNNA